MKLHSAVFYSKDINSVEEFYRNKLGFSVEYKSENKFISFIIGEGGRLAIKKQIEDREVPGHQTIFIEVDDIEEFYTHIQDQSLKILKPLTEEKWAKEFTILDPDGNKVLFRNK